MKPTLARKLVLLYPRGWRARYEQELLALLEQTPLTFGAIADVTGGALRERVTTAFRFDPEPVSVAREAWRDAVSTVAVILVIYVGAGLIAPILPTAVVNLSEIATFLVVLPVTRGLVGLVRRQGLSSTEYVGWLAVLLLLAMIAEAVVPQRALVLSYLSAAVVCLRSATRRELLRQDALKQLRDTKLGAR